MKIHLLGISGSGMRGIAEILKEQGHHVTGTDINDSASKYEMINHGFMIYDIHSKKNIRNIDLLIYSNAISQDNVEIIEAKKRLIPVWSRMKAVNWIFTEKKTRIGIIGSVGKSSMVSIFESIFGFQNEVSVYLGARSPYTGKFGSWNDSKIGIVECCEYQNSYFDITLDTAILTDIVENHEDFFGAGIANTIESFKRFLKISKAKFIYVPQKFSEAFKEFDVITYGDLNESKLKIVSSKEKKIIIELNGTLKTFRTSKYIPKQNLIKSLPAIQIALEMGFNWDEIIFGIEQIKLPARRLEVKNVLTSYFSYDDNARNVEQIRNTIESVRELHPQSNIYLLLNIWGKKNQRLIIKMIGLFNEYPDVKFIIDELGDADITRGCVERSEVLNQIISNGDLIASNVSVYTKSLIDDILCDTRSRLETVFITCGYDRHLERFNSFHKELKQKVLEGSK